MQFRRADGAADLVLLLEHQNVPAGVGEHGRRGQAVLAGADDDGVDGLGAHSPTPFGSVACSAMSMSRRRHSTLRGSTSRAWIAPGTN
ncbi:hypothetical protein AIIKEEIJ_00831 [Rhodococcus sp. YH1]|nr:hypothetical protein [Rhodococcus sp. YH1]